jgi:hypothetical protein
MAESDEVWSPPDAQDILIANIPENAQWYEVRTKLKTLSYTIDRFDDALKDSKTLKWVFKAELFYCCKIDGKLAATKIL